MKSTVHTAIALGLLAAPAAAQIQTVATESFDYPVPGLLNNQGSGTGFSDVWAVGASPNAVVMFGPGTGPAFPAADPIGGYAGQASGFGFAFRSVDINQHPDIVDGTGIGADGATVWISFTTVAYQQFGANYGGISLWDIVNDEQLFLGSPFGTGEWGVAPTTTGASLGTVSGTSETTPARLVYRIDHMAGEERVRLWVDPATPNPESGADLDLMVPDFRWSQLRLSSGGAGSAYYWDRITIEKGDSSFGTPFCPGAPNGTGAVGEMGLSGSPMAAANDITLQARNIPPGQFGIFVTSRQAGPASPVSQGFLCLSAPIGRFQGPGLIQQADPAGNFSLQIDLTAIPLASTTVPTMAGDTWYFQAWHRDFLPGGGNASNFTTGVSFTFL